VDDDQTELEVFRAGLAPRQVFTTTSVGEALEIARREKPDLALVDLRLEQPPSSGSNRFQDPRTNGYDLVRALRGEHPDMRIVMISGGRAWAFAVEARLAGANAMLAKQYGPEKLMLIIEGERLRDHDKEASPRVSLERATHEYVAAMFESTGRNIKRTAELLDVDRNTLKRRLRDNVDTTFPDAELDEALDNEESP
jgi:ActR/RegA family two-component response regulator